MRSALKKQVKMPCVPWHLSHPPNQDQTVSPKNHQDPSGDAHGGMKTTGTDTSKPDSEEEAPAPTESGKQHSSPVESESSGLSSSLLSDLLDYRNNPAPIGTLFQEDEDKASVKLKADEMGKKRRR
ncbi:hypothetical protein MTO96_018693 [Rhipicephalus appendiculatus]